MHLMSYPDPLVSYSLIPIPICFLCFSSHVKSPFMSNILVGETCLPSV